VLTSSTEIRFLVNHKTPKIRLVAVRNVRTGKEEDIREIGNENGWEVPDVRVMTLQGYFF
jgi:hypothetical protein